MSDKFDEDSCKIHCRICPLGDVIRGPMVKVSWLRTEQMYKEMFPNRDVYFSVYYHRHCYENSLECITAQMMSVKWGEPKISEVVFPGSFP